jgi:hypothetical protein
MTRLSLFTLIGAASAFLAWDWAAGGFALVAVLIATGGLLWILAETRGWRPAANLGFLLGALAAGAGEWYRLPPAPLLLALVLTLAAWDLADFSRRLASAAKEDDIPALERRHFARLGLVLALGAGLGWAALNLRSVRFKFEIAAVLALLGTWGLTQLILRLRKTP